jgi:virulence-associated protein VapD
MIEGKLKIGDEAYALQLLSNVHGEDPRRPIRELVENAADAEATRIKLIVNKRGFDPYIVCRDDGRGIPVNFLMSLPENVCNSIKRQMKMQTGGVHGIGLLSFNTIGDRLRIISRSRGSADTYAMEFEGVKRYRQIPVDRPLEESGTEVYIYGIDKDKKLLNAERLVEYLAREFEDDLIEGRFSLEVQQDSKRIPVTRDRIIAGTPVISSRHIPTNWGDIVVSINYGGRGGVALTRRGITIMSNISNLPEIEGEVWKSGKIGGTIRFDAINVSTDKKNPIRDELFRVLIERISELEPEIAQAVAALEQSENEKSRERLYKYLATRLDEVLRNLNFDRMKALMQATKKAEQEAEVGKTGEVISDKPGRTEKGGAPKRPAVRGDRKKSLRSVYGINWEEVSDLEHPRSRSRFDAKFGTIYINRVHPDFTKKVLKAKNDLEKLDYFYKVTVKEVILHQFEGAPACDILEKLLDIQLAMEKAPPTL